MQSHAITCNHMQSHAITYNHLSINEEKVRGLEITMGNGETMQMRQPARHLI